MTSADDTTPETHADPQTHLDSDPVNRPDHLEDPAADTGEDEGLTSEAGPTRG
jgi:hypothetical protein